MGGTAVIFWPDGWNQLNQLQKSGAHWGACFLFINLALPSSKSTLISNIPHLGGRAQRCPISAEGSGFSLFLITGWQILKFRSTGPAPRPSHGGPSLLPGILRALGTGDPFVGFGSPSEAFASGTEHVGFLRRLFSRNVKTFPVWKPVKACSWGRSPAGHHEEGISG